jgi:hypothetical protein
MSSFDLIGPDGSLVELVGPNPAPPLAHFLALFDRLLDPSTLEDEAGNPKVGIAALQSVAAATGIPVTTNFVPNGDPKFNLLLPTGPSITVTPICGMPSGAVVMAALDLTKVRSHDKTLGAVVAADAAAMLSFTTEPLAATTDVPMAVVDAVTGLEAPAEVDAALVVTVTFNNFTPGDKPGVCADLPSTRSHIHVAAMLAGVPVAGVAAVIAQDAGDPSKWTVSPPGTTADGPGAWPAGAIITILVDAMATNLFAQPLGTEASASFMVKS